jgi:hypothetical protein
MMLRKTTPGTASRTERLDRGWQYEVANEIACDFLIGVSVWFDILGSASTRSRPFMQTNFQYLDYIELDKVMGCESSVMILIAKISQLEQWKLEMQQGGRLSILQLGARAQEIKNLLNNTLARQMIPPPSTSASKHVHIITKVFTCAALTYLHTVVSGAHPELLEIEASVSMTIEAFGNLPDPKLLQNLIWPFCITGCMASKDREPFFKSLLSMPNIDEQGPGNYWKAFEVIQECWKLREQHGGACGKVDWTSAMKSLGYEVLLV